MRHRKAGRRFDMPTAQRNAMLRNITQEVLRAGGVETSVARAKESRRHVEKMITLAKRGTVHARRQARAFIYDADIVDLLFEEVGPRYAERPGGYTRVVKLGPRVGDASQRARLELV